MSQQLDTKELQYEGFPLEAVLGRVYAEQGADAAITSADRVRKGGFAGFFTKEVFRVTVAIDEHAAPPESPVDTARADARASTTPPEGFVTLGRIDLTNGSHGAGADPTAHPDRSAVFDDFDEIDPEDIDGALELDAPEARNDEERAIWAMLAEMTKPSAVADREDVPVATTSTDPETGLETGLETDLETSVDAEPVEAIEPAVKDNGRPTAALMEFPRETLPVEIVTPIVSSGPIASTLLIAPSATVRPPTLPAPPARRPAVHMPALGGPDTGRNSTGGAAIGPTGHAFTTEPTGGSVPNASVPHIGLAAPGRVVTLRSRRVRRSFGADLDLNGLIAEFANTTGNLVGTPDVGVIAIVGVHDEAIAAAASLALRLNIDPDDVVIAAPLDHIRIPTELDATRLAATARFRCTPVAIVVVELVPGRIGHEWVRAVLEGLRAEQVRFAVSADRLIAQQRLTIAALGGVDAIDLTAASQCPAPEEALDLGVPIATIDGHPATPEMWAATVLASDHREQSSVARDVVGTR